MLERDTMKKTSERSEYGAILMLWRRPLRAVGVRSTTKFLLLGDALESKTRVIPS